MKNLLEISTGVNSLIDDEHYLLASVHPRVSKALICKNNIRTFRPLMNMNQDEIKMLIGIGKKSAEEIITVIEKINII